MFGIKEVLEHIRSGDYNVLGLFEVPTERSLGGPPMIQPSTNRMAVEENPFAILDAIVEGLIASKST